MVFPNSLLTPRLTSSVLIINKWYDLLIISTKFKIKRNTVKSFGYIKRLTFLLANKYHVEIKEVGSTAIPGCIGKGDIDILTLCNKFDLNNIKIKLLTHYKLNHNQINNNTLCSFVLSRKNDVAVQLVVKDSKYGIFDYFLDFMKNNPDYVDEYNKLKFSYNNKKRKITGEQKIDLLEIL